VADVVLIVVLIGAELMSKLHVVGSIPLEGLLARQDSVILDRNPPTTSMVNSQVKQNQLQQDLRRRD
jgi:hypothetical protein